MGLLNLVKRNKVSTALLGVLLVTSFSAAAVIIRSQETDYIYLDEFGNVVGEYTVPCEGRAFGWGITTSNVLVTTLNCQPPSPPPPSCPNCVP